jgi:N-methylhydantoinase A/oxoprolinase/acetone carboxylase beta subunit
MRLLLAISIRRALACHLLTRTFRQAERLKRAPTAVLNARLIGMIDRLVAACEQHLLAGRHRCPGLMVVRGDGALISAAAGARTAYRDDPVRPRRKHRG